MIVPTYSLRAGSGNQPYEEAKARLYGAGVTALISQIPQGNGKAPRAVLVHRLSLEKWQPLAIAAVILFLAYYLVLRG